MWQVFSRILPTGLVEDNPIIRESLIDFVEDDKKAVVVGWTDQQDEASHWLRSNPGMWDLAVIDLFLAKGNGIGLLTDCHCLRALGQKMVVLSNYATAPMRERCLASGADAVFDKSTELDEFLLYIDGLSHWKPVPRL
jgi:two-component system OmpR family response regulator